MRINLQDSSPWYSQLSYLRIVVIMGLLLIFMMVLDFVFIKLQLVGLKAELEQIHKYLQKYRPLFQKYNYIKEHKNNNSQTLIAGVKIINILPEIVSKNLKLNHLKITGSKLSLAGTAADQSSVKIFLNKARNTSIFKMFKLFKLHKSGNYRFQIRGAVLKKSGGSN